MPPENTYGATYQAWATLPVGAVTGKVVLMRVGSVTHHFDSDQRYLEMEAIQDPDGQFVNFTLPTNRDKVPPGFYMAFLVTTTGLPSEAHWFWLQ